MSDPAISSALSRPGAPPAPDCAAHAAGVLAVTQRAWQVPPPTAQALARRAPHGGVSRRAVRRAAARHPRRSGPLI